MGTTYKESGVNIEAGEQAVSKIKNKIKSTFSKEVLAGIGHFGAFYEASFTNYSRPVLVSSADGVGTKLKIAFSMNKHDTIGSDLVNHCVNDILTSGAKPLFFLDYIGTGILNPDTIQNIVEGMVNACKANSCSLVGGEMAEMPGLYQNEEYDVAGTIVGLVDKDKIINGSKIKSGQILIGLKSKGLHTNGYSLARKVLLNKYSLNTYFKEFSQSLGEELLTTHKSYLFPVQELISKIDVSGISHITGGGIIGNTKRIFPESMKFHIDWDTLPVLPIFNLIQNTDDISDNEMRHVFNMGIGMILIVNESDVDSSLDILRKAGEDAVVIGHTLEA